jgi:hypothetical protein
VDDDFFLPVSGCLSSVLIKSTNQIKYLNSKIGLRQISARQHWCGHQMNTQPKKIGKKNEIRWGRNVSFGYKNSKTEMISVKFESLFEKNKI